MTQVPERIRSMLEESGIDADVEVGLVEALAALEQEFVDAVPVPASALAELLGADSVSSPSSRSPKSRRVAVAGVMACGVLAATGGLAAANELPAPAQRWFAELSALYLPFDLPYPLEADSDETGSSRGLPGDPGRDPEGPVRGGGDRGDEAHDSPPAATHPDTVGQVAPPHRSGGRQREELGEPSDEDDLVGETPEASEREDHVEAEPEESVEPAREREDRTEARDESDAEGSSASSESSTDREESDAPEHEEQVESTEGGEGD